MSYKLYNIIRYSWTTKSLPRYHFAYLTGSLAYANSVITVTLASSIAIGFLGDFHKWSTCYGNSAVGR